MKKVLLMLSLSMLISPISTHAAIKHRKHKKIHSEQKSTAVAEQATTNNNTTTTAYSATPLPTKSESETESEDESTDEKAKSPTWLDNLSGTFNFTTNYMFRGISLSENNPATQGGLTYTFNGNEYGQPYFNVWGSNANYSAPDGKRVTSEFDTIAGWLGKYGEDFSYNINMDRYNYPGARSANYNELNTLWTYKILQLGLSYTGNYSGTHASGTYYNGTVTVPIPPQYFLGFQDVNLAAEMGHYSLAKAAGNSYNDYSLALNKKISEKYAMAAMWTGTNGRAKLPPFDGNQIVGTITAVF